MNGWIIIRRCDNSTTQPFELSTILRFDYPIQWMEYSKTASISLHPSGALIVGDLRRRISNGDPDSTGQMSSLYFTPLQCKKSVVACGFMIAYTAVQQL